MRVVMPLPDRDFDTTEVAVPWRVLSDRGHEVVFATERGGAPPACDPRLLGGVLFGRLGADPEPIEFYEQLVEAPEFQAPIPWGDIDPDAFDGLLLAGGHAPGMRQYLASTALQRRWSPTGNSTVPSARYATVSSFSPAPPTQPPGAA